MQNKMNGNFGGGKFATGTPSLGWSCVVIVCSLLGGASIVHNIYKPNLVCCMNCLFELILLRENVSSCRLCHLWKK